MKLLLSVFIFALFLACSSAKKLNLNAKVDSVLAGIRRLKASNRSLNIADGAVDEMGPGMVNIGAGKMCGLNSLIRTGDCIEIVESTRKTFHFQIGLKLLNITLPRVTFNGVPMSTSFIIEDNSLTLNYTVQNDNCCVTVDLLQVEQFQKIRLGSARTDFDGLGLDQMFQNSVRKWINKGLDKIRPDLEDRFRFRCLIPMTIEEKPPTDVAEAFASLIEDIAMF